MDNELKEVISAAVARALMDVACLSGHERAMIYSHVRTVVIAAVAEHQAYSRAPNTRGVHAD